MGTGAANLDQVQRGGISFSGRCSEEGAGAARWDQAQRGKKKNQKDALPSPSLVHCYVRAQPLHGTSKTSGDQIGV